MNDQQSLVDIWLADLQSAIRTIPNLKWVLSSIKRPGLNLSQRNDLIVKLMELKSALNSSPRVSSCSRQVNLTAACSRKGCFDELYLASVLQGYRHVPGG
jgi:hypothetical protein